MSTYEDENGIMSRPSDVVEEDTLVLAHTRSESTAIKIVIA
jgi:hypothetical protein